MDSNRHQLDESNPPHAQHEPNKHGIIGSDLQPSSEVAKNRKPTSINITPTSSSVNLHSNNSQNLDTSSLRTNNSSDNMATYDSDTCWPLSTGSSGARMDTVQGSATRLDGQCTDDGSTFDENDLLDFNRRASTGHFSIGPEDLTEDHNEANMLYLDSDDTERYNRRTDSMYDDQDLNLDDDASYDSHKQVIVGICAMEKKAQSKPMKEILRRLEDYFEYIRTLIFEESVILNKSIEEWPLCDCLISFHSKGFPLSKAIEYARLRRPFLVNDLDIQYDIQDRRKVYKILEEADIELPRYAVLDRDSSNSEERELVESDDHIEVSNFVFNKPFVEKPISAEDHNICIYYPAHAGGGSQRLFRKIGCRSSVYSQESHVRKTGSYIYEEFMPTDGTDVKVYTAGPDYAHAEARKSPALDGKVERDKDGKEIRYPVILTNREKMIARKVCLAFRQTICGFDLLRANGKSYVCDVNGFSFVKSSMKYYEDCSKILGNMMLRALAPQLHIPWSIPFQLDDPPIVPTTFGRMMELRCVIAVIRHGDRTPKQKMKLEVKHLKFFDLYHKYGKNGQAKLKKPKQLQEVLDIARYLLGEFPDQPPPGEVIEPRVKLRQLKSVLEMYGHFSGINRKVQLKYQPHGRPRRSSSEDDCAREPSLVLILKWGGELTPAGRVQAEDLGRCFRRLYPASGDYSGPQGLGLLRLHSTFRHDLKIYASDEGRVQMTAAAFAKGFLALEGELTPILFQMVKSANTNGLLDNDCESSKCQKIVKERLHNIMQKNHDLSAAEIEILNPTCAPSIDVACRFIKNPYQACEKVHKLIKELNTLVKTKRQDNGYTQEYHLYHGETWDLLQRRWAKLEKDFKFPRSKRFDISKIPDIYDCIKYDLQHNQHTLQFQFAHELHTYAKALADIVIPQEYGMTSQEKLMISLGTCSPLLRKIQADLLRNADSSNEDETESVNRLDPKYSHGVSSPDRHVRTRLYFTSESHIHSLVTALQFGGLLDVKKDEQWHRSMEFLAAISELNYLSQIVIMLYEDPTKEPTANDRFHVEIHFSSGVINRITQQNMPTEPQGPGFRPHMHNKSYSNASDDNTTINRNDSAQDAIIKEEQTDDERSTDEGSKGNSKNSSACITPKKTVSPNSGGTPEFNQLDDPKLDEIQKSSQSNPSNFQRLSRSYSAVAPVSLQNLFKKSGADELDDNSSSCEKQQANGACVVEKQSESYVGLRDITDEQQTIPVGSIESGENTPTFEDRSSPNINDSSCCVTPTTNTPDRRIRDSKTPRIRVRNNSRSSESRSQDDEQPCLIAPDFNQTPQHIRHYQIINNGYNRRRQQLDQIQLPPTYHTIHHVNFPPSTLKMLSRPAASMSTSPQQISGSGFGGSNIHQRYIAHKQQQLNKQLSSLSASMPIHYKSNQNHRACSVADVSQYCGGPSSLISTAVISGSSPELVAICPYSPAIRPLETLHNELSLRQFNDFIYRLTRNQKQQITDTNNIHSDAKDDGKTKGQITNENSQEGIRCCLSSEKRRDSEQPSSGKLSLDLNSIGNYRSSAGSGAGQLSASNRPLGLSPGNSLSNSLIWGGISSSPGAPSSPSSAVMELWSKLELDDINCSSTSDNTVQSERDANIKSVPLTDGCKQSVEKVEMLE